MKKSILIAMIVLVSCGKKAETTTATKENEKPSTVVGGDSDEHGCKASAGFTWSVLKNECVRTFEAGTRLNHVKEEGKTFSTCSYVIMADDKNKAELFLDNGDKPLILESNPVTKSWINGDWELVPDNGYLLKKGGKTLYSTK